MARRLKADLSCGLQFAALPLMRDGDRTVVLLITSRETRRWVLPKGWAEKGLKGC